MKKILTVCLIVCAFFVAQNSLSAQNTDGVCTPATTVDPIIAPGVTEVCSDGSTMPAVVFAAAVGSLPNADYVIEVNGNINLINADGSIDPTTLAIGDQVCATAFAYDLAAIDGLLGTANTLCGLVDCDAQFGIPGITQAISDLATGVNDGTPGLNSLQEALDFAGSFGTPITDVLTATTTLDALNVQIGGFGLPPVCYATSAPVCYDIIDCTPACTAMASAISTTDLPRICVDGVPDPINVAVDVDGGGTGVWVVTDPTGFIFATYPGSPFDFDNAGPGICLIWLVNSDDPNFDVAFGDDISTVVAATPCTFLSNSIAVDRIEVTAPVISTTDPTTICIDGVADPINVAIDDAGIGANATWVITDAAATILALPAGPPFDLDGAGPGQCLIWLVNSDDPNFAPAVGDDAAAAVAAATCAALSNPITVDRIEVTAPVISTTDPTTICADDGIDDLINVTIDDAGTGGTTTAWVITDAAGTILALPPAPPFNLEGAGGGTCLIWLVSTNDASFAPAVGDNAAAAVAAATCATLSNSIAITRQTNCAACTASASTISTTDPTRICIDGVGDPINVNFDVTGMGAGAWVITDAAGTILALPPAPPFDLDGAGAGQCLIWYVNVEDDAFAPAVGDDAMAVVAASSCAFLSNPITVDRIEVTAPTISTTDPTTICADDGIDDPINVTIDDAGIGNNVWVITDAAGIILAFPPGPPFNLEGAGAGTCLIWLANVDDPSFMPQLGDDAAAAIAAATCAVLSNPIAIEREINCGSTDPTIGLSDPCNCANGIDLDDDGVIDLASETVTIAPGTIPYTVTDYSGGLVDMTGTPLTLDDIQILIDAAVPDASGNISFDAYLPTDGVTVFSIEISDSAGATASFTKPTGCPSCAEPENVPTVGEWGLIILGLLMSITAVVGIRARRREEIYG